MKFKIVILVLFSILGIGLNLYANDKAVISVFYKNQKPSQQVLEKVNATLKHFKDSYQINYYLIDDPENSELIAKFGLPSTHFPFAILINGKFTAKIEDKVVSFVHFPQFMKGIGRHEGNWSITDLEKVLLDNSLLLEENILPVLVEEKKDSECDE